MSPIKFYLAYTLLYLYYHTANTLNLGLQFTKLGHVFIVFHRPLVGLEWWDCVIYFRIENKSTECTCKLCLLQDANNSFLRHEGL